MADDYDDDDLDLEDDEDLDDDDIDEDEDDDIDDNDADYDDEEITRENAIAYGHHLEAEHAKEKKRADQAEAESSILRKAMAKQAKKPAKPTEDEIIDRDFESGGRDIDKPFRI